MKSLNVAFYPTISEIGFLRAQASQCVKAFTSWLRPIYKPLGITFSEKSAANTFDDSLRQLLPLTNIKEQRFLLMPTGGPWTAFFTNALSQPDVSSPISYLAQAMQVDGLRICTVPDDADNKYPARILDMFGPRPLPILNDVRSVYCIFDGTNWEFGEGGERQPFEQPSRYSAKRIKDRFTSKMLEEYGDALGVRFYDETFYKPEGAILVEKIGPTPAGMKTLQEFPGLRLK